MPEAFHARFPVSVKPKTWRRPIKLLVKREKKPLVPRVGVSSSKVGLTTWHVPLCRPFGQRAGVGI